MRGTDRELPRAKAGSKDFLRFFQKNEFLQRVLIMTIQPGASPRAGSSCGCWHTQNSVYQFALGSAPNANADVRQPNR